jgi:hypothetical protein
MLYVDTGLNRLKVARYADPRLRTRASLPAVFSPSVLADREL